MLFLQETHTVPWTFNFGRWHPTPTRETRKHSKNASTKNPKEVKQFLGLVGYYRKFVPRFADISRVLTHLTKNDVEFKWTPECENCFQILKEFLQQAPILRYPDPQANYTLHRCIKIRIRRHTDTTQQWHGPPYHLRKWTILWITIKLGNTHEGSLRNLHVNKETQFLHRHSQNNS